MAQSFEGGRKVGKTVRRVARGANKVATTKKKVDKAITGAVQGGLLYGAANVGAPLSFGRGVVSGLAGQGGVSTAGGSGFYRGGTGQREIRMPGETASQHFARVAAQARAAGAGGNTITRAALPSGGGAPNGTVGSPAPTPVASGGGSSTSTGSTSSRRPPATKVPKYKQPLPGPDQIELMIRGALQQSRRLTDQYAGQNEAIRQAVVADAQKLGAQAGSFQGQTAANTGLSATDAQAKSYVDLINAVGGAQSNQVASEIGNQGNILQQALGGYGSQAQRGHVEYGRQLRAQEPGLRRDYEAAQADAALKLAEQQFLRDKLNVDTKKDYDLAAANLDLGYYKTDKQSAYQQARLDLDKQKAAGGTKGDYLAGLRLNSALRKEANKWVNDNLFTKVTTTQKVIDKDGNEISTSVPERTKVPKNFNDVYVEMQSAGFDPAVAYGVARQHDPKGVKGMGAARYYRMLVQELGTAHRAAIKEVGKVFGTKVSRKVLKNKNAILNAAA